MKITNEDSLTSVISEELESEAATDATATARDIVITVASFEAVKEGPCEPDAEPATEPATEPETGPEPESDPGNSPGGE